MTREELIEKLWEEYSVAVRDEDYGYMRVIDDVSFVSAVNAALDAQARGCESVYKEESLKMHPWYYSDMAYSILTADPEVTP